MDTRLRSPRSSRCGWRVRCGFDVIHTHNPPDLFGLIAGFYRLFGKKYVFDHHDLGPEMYLARFSGPGNRFIYRTLLWIERHSCRWAHHIIATNDSYKRIEMERTGVPASRITVVRNGPEPWHLDDCSPLLDRRDDQRIVIGYVGAMGFQDGLDYLLRALHVLKNDLGRADWTALLIGSGDAVDTLRETAAALGLTDQLSFTGWVDYEKVPQYIASTDICVAPDPSNNYNDRSTIVKVMEYMAQAKPVVAFDLPEHRVTAGDTALFAQPNDEREFARLLLRLMDDAPLRRALGEAGRRRVAERLTWQRQVPHLLAAYQCALTGRNDPKYAVANHSQQLHLQEPCTNRTT